jgi:hypothetical protein
MGCACGSQTGLDREPIFRGLEAVGLREVGEQAFAVVPVVESSLRRLRTAERAEALGYGPEMAAAHREAAQRDNRQALRQIRAVIARLDDMVGRDDWRDLSERATGEFMERDGRAVLEESRERLRLSLLEADGVWGDDAHEVMTVVDASIGRAVDGGLDRVARHLREVFFQSIAALEHDEMGRQPASPLTGAALAVCIGVAVVLATAAQIGCLFVPFCWCCFAGQIWAACAAAVAACIAAPDLSGRPGAA